eukprot:scaffold40777_cov39-Prasinocladus_malaysianus.AAC.2
MDWRASDAIPAGSRSPTVCILHNGIKYQLEPQTGPEGLRRFRCELAAIMNLPSPDMVKLVFDCIDPFSGERMTLRGAHTYDAAIFCASVAAAKL